MTENKNSIIRKRVIGTSACVGVLLAYFLLTNLAKMVTKAIFENEYSLVSMTFKELIYAVLALVLGAVLSKPPAKMLSIPHSSSKRRLFLRFFLMLTLIYFPLSIIVNIMMQRLNEKVLTLRPADEIMCFVILMLLIGIAEETMFRGIIASSMKNIFGKKNLDIASFISGLSFGLFHLVNLSIANTEGVLCQVCSAAAAGMIFTDLYYLTGTLWPCIVYHAITDFGCLMGFGLFGIGAVGDIISSYSPVMCIVPAIYITVKAVFIVRKRSSHQKRTAGISGKVYE